MLTINEAIKAAADEFEGRSSIERRAASMMGPTVTQEQVAAWLTKHAPEIAALVEKDQPGVGDVHATTALGNDRKRRKLKPQGHALDNIGTAKSFDEVMAFKDELILARVPSTDGDVDVVMKVDVRKADNENQQVFGWASVTTIDGDEVVDKQGDIIPTDEIEKSAYEFVQFSRDMGDMHQRLGTGRMIESVVFTKEKAACGIVAKDEDGKAVEGWWVGFHVVDPATWQSFKAGHRPELSIGGRASIDD